MTYEEAAIEVLKETGETRVWLGNPNLWHEIYARRNGRHSAHPMNAHKAIMAALERSPKFKRNGYIRSPGFLSSHETRHPVYVLVGT